MTWIALAAVLGAAIGAATASYVLWPSKGWRKYRVCKLERAATETLLTEIKPVRAPNGRFARKAA